MDHNKKRSKGITFLLTITTAGCSYKSMKDCVASRRLRDLLTPRMRQTELAEKLGVTQQAVSHWVSGMSRPDPDRMKQIEDLLGIPMAEWTASESS